MITFTPTPSRAAGLDQVDTTAPPISSSTAALVILAGYLLFFGSGILSAIYVARAGIVLPATDYSAFNGIYEVVRRMIDIAGAGLILFLVCRWLGVGRQLAGIPRYPASPIPALTTAGIALTGMAVATMILAALQPATGADPNAAAGGAVANAWALLSLVGALSAGVVEEIIIIAVPVLVGRRAGWHPAAIIAISMLMRWPFHVYHGAWTSLPWAMIWGGANTTAFLYLRRLAPLVVVHAFIDAVVGMRSAFGAPGQTLVILAALGTLAYFGWRLIADQRRRLNPAAATTDAEGIRHLCRPRTRRDIAFLAAAAVLIAAGVSLLVVGQPNNVVGTAAGAGVAIAALTAVAAVGWRWFKATNVIVRRDEHGHISGVIRWHTTYTGYSAIDTISTGIDDLDAVRQVATLDRQPVVLPPGNKAHRARFAALGHPTTGRHPFRQIRIPAQDAVALTTEQPIG